MTGVHSFPSQQWAVISKTQMKNAKKAFNREQMKNDAKDKKEVCSAIQSERDLLDLHCVLTQNVSTNKSDSVMIVTQTEDTERREKNLEEAKKITIKNDPSLPQPDTVGGFIH